MLTDYIDRKTANVYGIYGHLGGGKSLTAVEISLWALSCGWDVISNIELFNLPDTHRKRFHFLDDFEGTDFWSLPCGAPRGSPDPYRTVIIIDECAEFFDQYSSTSSILQEFLSWLRHSSKRGQFVFLVVQKPEFIAKSLRLLINRWIICDDMEQFRLPFFKIRIPFTRNFVSRRVFDRKYNFLSRGFNFADKRVIGRFYNTAQSIAIAGHQQNQQQHEIYQNQSISLLDIAFVLFVLFLLIYT